MKLKNKARLRQAQDSSRAKSKGGPRRKASSGLVPSGVGGPADHVSLAHEIASWMERLGPGMPEISREDLHLILWNRLRRNYGGELKIFIRRNRGGGYVF